MKELVAVVLDAKGAEKKRIYAVPAGANGVKVHVTEPSVPAASEVAAEPKTVLRVETKEYKEYLKAQETAKPKPKEVKP